VEPKAASQPRKPGSLGINRKIKIPSEFMSNLKLSCLSRSQGKWASKKVSLLFPFFQMAGLENKKNLKT
jgi:hypothetical protein